MDMFMWTAIGVGVLITFILIERYIFGPISWVRCNNIVKAHRISRRDKDNGFSPELIKMMNVKRRREYNNKGLNK